MVFQFLITKGIQTDCSSTVSDGTIYKRSILKTEQSCLPPLYLEKKLQSQSKWLGHSGVSLSPQCWCTRFGDRTAINNFERDEVSTRREKTAFG